ncbi:MAG: Spy/CpxP family protein refolding chaperone [Tatlockia sp.]|jgi:Spy/CpxP family protein refolding chaperone
MNKKLITVVAFVFSFALGQVAYADNWGCGEKIKTMVESLNLDSGQKDKIKPVMEQLKTSMEGSVTQMKDISGQLKQQMESTTMDQSTVNDLIDKKTKIIGDMMKAKVMAMNQVYNILNPQQKMQLQTKVKQVEEKMEEHFKSCHDE